MQQIHESERDSNSNVCLASDRGIRVWRTRERDHRMDRTRRRQNWRLFSIGSAPSNRIATMLNCTNYLFHLIICAWMRVVGRCERMRMNRSFCSVFRWPNVGSRLFSHLKNRWKAKVFFLRSYSFIVSDGQAGVFAFWINYFSAVCRQSILTNCSATKSEFLLIGRTDEESHKAAILKIEMKIGSCALQSNRIDKLFLSSYFSFVFSFLNALGLWGNNF